jgi:carbon monoxide dehydrogenase subunit G
VIVTGWEIRIDRPAEQVFDFVADLRNGPTWNPDSSNVVLTSGGPVGPGSVFEEDRERFGRTVTTIDAFERPARLGFDARASRVHVRVRYAFEPDGAATKVTCTAELRLRGASRLLEPVLRAVARRGVETSRGPALKAALER